MLRAMRQHAKYFYVLFFIVILSFIFWGVGTVDKSGDTNIVAEVGGYKIPTEEYWQSYDRIYKFYREIYKEKFDEAMQKSLNLKEGVLNSLIENRVLLIAAKDNGITVSDAELNEAIKNEPAFMKGGVFDNDIYQNRLRLNRLTPEAYEAAKREDLIVEKMKRMIELSAPVPPEEPTNVAAQDDQAAKAFRETAVNSARANAVRAYVEGLKKGLKIKIYPERLS
ncbi:MAG: SurA N-terminal domain-containing protein [Acidobacteriota bacterium]